MNSIHRLGLTIATVAAVATVGGAFAVQGYVAASQATGRAAAQTAQTAAQTAASPAPEIVYISPVQAAPTAPPAQQPPVIHVVVPAYGDGDGHGEGSDN